MTDRRIESVAEAEDRLRRAQAALDRAQLVFVAVLAGRRHLDFPSA